MIVYLVWLNDCVIAVCATHKVAMDVVETEMRTHTGEWRQLFPNAIPSRDRWYQPGGRISRLEIAEWSVRPA